MLTLQNVRYIFLAFFVLLIHDQLEGMHKLKILETN